MRKLLNILQRPLLCEPATFAGLCGVACLAFFSTLYCGSTGLGTLVTNIFFAYLASFVISCLPSVLRPVSRWLLIVYSVVMALLVLFGALFIRTASAMNTLMLILQTNTQEVREFFRYFVNLRAIGLTLLILSVCSAIGCMIYYVITDRRMYAEHLRRVISLGSCMTIPLISILPINVLQTTPQLEICFTDLDLVFHHHDLREYAVLPQVEEISSSHPATVVLIIGESHHRSHCSLLGYDKETNPELQQLVDSHNLVPFDSVYAPAPYTGLSLRRMLSTYGRYMRPCEEGKNWWECQTIPTTFRAMGYETFWITNQKGGATRDAIADSYAQLCDHTFRTEGRNAYDGALLPILAILVDSSTPRLFVIHLMGSHEAYDQRFPADFRHFQACDYPNLPEHQRQTVADYDNSLRYNDYVVAEILSLFSDQSTVAVYCPDHAIDLFMTDPTYAAHAKADSMSQRVSLEIPMFVYLSNEFMRNVDNYDMRESPLYDRLLQWSYPPFSSEDLIYMIMNLTGFKFKK